MAGGLRLGNDRNRPRTPRAQKTPSVRHLIAIFRPQAAQTREVPLLSGQAGGVEWYAGPLNSPRTHEATQLLNRLSQGDGEASERLMAILYDELRDLARGHMMRERSDHTLEPTALVHEAWMRLARVEGDGWESRKQFFALASRVMRAVLVDHARNKNTEKRGGGAARVTLDGLADVDRSDNVLDVDSALGRLTEADPDLAHLVELRFFGGLAMDEIARILDTPKRTVERRWSVASAWLRREIECETTDRS